MYVSPTGAKVWRIAYRVEGRPQTKSFGAYPTISLAEARAQREALKADLRAGIDPAADNRARRAGGVTLAAATERYWEGWRTVASTWANERGYSPDAIERQLAHVPENRVRSAFNRAEYMPERSRMLQSWADWLDEAEAERITSG